PNSNNFGNQNLPGQRDIPIIRTALNTSNDSTFATTISRGEAGRLAANIAQDATRMGRLTSSQALAGIIKPITLPDPHKPGESITLSNFFVANPRAPTSSFLMDNIADSNYHALQAELRRRLSKGLLVQGSYAWAKSLSNTFDQSAAADVSSPTT